MNPALLRHLVFWHLVLSPAVPRAASGSDWPQFRGPLGTGVVPAAALPTEWGEDKNVAWKVAVPGQGWSQPVVVGGIVYLTTASGAKLETPMGMEAGVADPRTWKAGTPPDVLIDWRVVALDLATGKTQCFNDAQAFLACFDGASGKELWRVKREKPGTSWATPLVWRNEKRVEVVASGGKFLTSHDPATGKELWRIDGVWGPGQCSFGADKERLYFGQSSPMANPPLYALAAGADGDLSPAQGSADVRGQVWSQQKASPGMPSPVVVDAFLYIVEDTFLTCRDAGTGDELYKERLPDMVTVAASPIVVGDKLVLLDEEGRGALVQVGPTLEIVGRGKLDDVFWSTPSVAGDALLFRGIEHLYCVRK